MLALGGHDPPVIRGSSCHVVARYVGFGEGDGRWDEQSLQ